jgi:hypothetical protein
VGFVKPAPKALHDEARYSTTCHYTESPDAFEESRRKDLIFMMFRLVTNFI